MTPELTHSRSQRSAKETAKSQSGDQLDLSSEGQAAAEKLQEANAAAESAPTSAVPNIFLNVSNKRIAVLERINAIVAENGLKVDDGRFIVQLDRRDGSISVKETVMGIKDPEVLEQLQTAIDNDEQLASLIEETYTALHSGKASEMTADLFGIEFSSFDTKYLTAERDRQIGLIGWTNTDNDPDYSAELPSTTTLLAQSLPSVMSLDRRLEAQPQEWVSAVREKRVAVLERVNSIIAEKGLDVSEGRFTVQWNRKDGSLAIVGMSGAAAQAELNKAIQGDKQLAALLKETFDILCERNDPESFNDLFGIEFSSFSEKDAKYINASYMLTQLPLNSESTQDETVKGQARETGPYTTVLSPLRFDYLFRTNTISLTDGKLDLTSVLSESGLVSPVASSDGNVALNDPAAIIAKSKHKSTINWGLGLKEGEQLSANRAKLLLASAKAEEKWLDKRISQLLKDNKITLSSKESLHFKVDRDGQIKVDGIKDKQKAEKIEKILNSDPSLGRDLLNVYATKAAADGQAGSKVKGIFIDQLLRQELGISSSDVGYDPETGTVFDKTGSVDLTSWLADEGVFAKDLLESLGLDSKVGSSSFDVGFSYKNGTVIDDESLMSMRTNTKTYQDLQRKGVPENPIGARFYRENMERLAQFNGSETVAKLIGLDETLTNGSSILDALDKSIAKDSAEMQKTLAAKLKEAGLEDETKKITFSLNANGKISVEGVSNKIKQRQIESLVNDESSLIEQMKSLKAKMEISRGLSTNSDFDLDSREMAASRRQLVKDYLKKNGDIDLGKVSSSLDPETGELDWQVDGQSNEKLAELAANDSEIQAELLNALDKDFNKAADRGERSRPLVSMKRGELSEGTDSKVNLQAKVSQFRAMISQKLDEYYAHNPTAWDVQIRDFSLEIGSGGELSATNVHTVGGDSKMDEGAKMFLESFFDASVRAEAKALGAEILEQHDDEHGDVAEFQHRIMIAAGEASTAYKIVSPEADRAALAEMQQLGNEISVELGTYFGKTFGLDQSFQIQIGADGKIRFDASNFESQSLVRNLEKTFNALNERIASDDPLGEDFKSSLPKSLSPVLEKLAELNAVREKLHDETLKDAPLVLTIEKSI